MQKDVLQFIFPFELSCCLKSCVDTLTINFLSLTSHSLAFFVSEVSTEFETQEGSEA